MYLSTILLILLTVGLAFSLVDLLTHHWLSGHFGGLYFYLQVLSLNFLAKLPPMLAQFLYRFSCVLAIMYELFLVVPIQLFILLVMAFYLFFAFWAYVWSLLTKGYKSTHAQRLKELGDLLAVRYPLEHVSVVLVNRRQKFYALFMPSFFYIENHVLCVSSPFEVIEICITRISENANLFRRGFVSTTSANSAPPTVGSSGLDLVPPPTIDLVEGEPLSSIALTPPSRVSSQATIHGHTYASGQGVAIDDDEGSVSSDTPHPSTWKDRVRAMFRVASDEPDIFVDAPNFDSRPRSPVDIALVDNRTESADDGEPGVPASQPIAEHVGVSLVSTSILAGATRATGIQHGSLSSETDAFKQKDASGKGKARVLEASGVVSSVTKHNLKSRVKTMKFIGNEGSSFVDTLKNLVPIPAIDDDPADIDLTGTAPGPFDKVKALDVVTTSSTDSGVLGGSSSVLNPQSPSYTGMTGERVLPEARRLLDSLRRLGDTSTVLRPQIPFADLPEYRSFFPLVPELGSFELLYPRKADFSLARTFVIDSTGGSGLRFASHVLSLPQFLSLGVPVHKSQFEAYQRYCQRVFGDMNFVFSS
jgi:hypothetical protein